MYKKTLDQFLFKYRVTPHSSTNKSPAELMFNRKVRTIFDLLRPSNMVQDRMEDQNIKMRTSSSKKKQRDTSFKQGDKVLVRMYSKGPKWKKANILQRTGSVTYKCKLQDGTIVFRHVNQMWHDRSHSPVAADPEDIPDNSDEMSIGFPEVPTSPVRGNSPVPSQHSGDYSFNSPVPSLHSDDYFSESLFSEDLEGSDAERQVHTSSGRQVKPPNRLNL